MNKVWPLILVVLFVLIGGGIWVSQPDAEFSPSGSAAIPKNEMPTVLAAAEKRDLPAVQRLIDHFERYEQNPARAEFWRSRARELGDEFELRQYGRRLLTRALYEAEDQAKKEFLLRESLVVAKRAVEASRSRENEELLADVRREIEKSEAKASQ